MDEIQKTQEEWNGAGPFDFLVTLKKHERERYLVATAIR
jgi:hypothetical protein